MKPSWLYSFFVYFYYFFNYNKIMKKLILMLFILFIFINFVFPNTASQYGINVHTANNKVLSKVKSAGIGWIRVDILWTDIERKKGVYDFSQIDRIVRYAKTHNLSILAIMGKTPDWANGGRSPAYPPKNINDWKKFVSKIVRRYSGTIKYWEIWNEPNLKDFFAFDKDIFVNKIFLPAAKTIKGINSKLFIVGPSLSNSTTQGNEWYFWMKYILTNCKNYIDIVSHHIYENRGVLYLYETLNKGEGLTPSVLEIVEECGFSNKPFWITETGWNTAYFSEDQQAEFYLDFLKKMRSQELPSKVFFYEIIDITGQNSLPWGILRTNRTEKPAYRVYRDFIAGKYPDEDDDDEINNEKCYAEKVTLNSTSIMRFERIRKMKKFRNNVLKYLNNKIINDYYKIENEIYKITIDDSRIYNKITNLIGMIDEYIDENGYLLKPFLDKKIKKNILDVISLFKQKDLSKKTDTYLIKLENIIKQTKNIREIINITK